MATPTLHSINLEIIPAPCNQLYIEIVNLQQKFFFSKANFNDKYQRNLQKSEADQEINSGKRHQTIKVIY